MAPASLILGPAIDHAAGISPTGLGLATAPLDSLTANSYPRDRWIPLLKTATEPFKGATLEKGAVGLDFGEPVEIGSVLLANLNSTSAAKARVRLSTSAISARERLPPSSTVSSPGFDFDHNAIDDDPESPDANFMETNTDGAAVGTFRLTAPAADYVLGSLQVARVLIEAPPEGPSTVRVEVDEGAGVLATPIPDTVVPASQAIILHGLWDAAVLGTIGGGLVQFVVTITGGQTTDGDTKLRALDCFALHESNKAGYEGPFREITPSGMAGATLGGVSLASTTLMRNFHEPVNLAEAVGGSLPIVYAPFSARFLELEIFDPYNPAGFNSAGILMAGPAVYLGGTGDSGPSRGWSPGIEPASPDNATRLMNIDLALLSNTEQAELLAYLLSRREPYFCVHVLPTIATDERTPWHLPLFMEPTGAVSLVEQLARQESVYSGSLTLRERWGVVGR